ncbi:hypothetical protein [Enterovirga aerilata]|uniref:Copper chaperone PCu(A)C n=1 Tax=Enterovirga aerilata TaxID=2730920 RepID=A0A849ID30_9HYPH|nr:hypothetical protein [Enterovirga sp. DB1703]NNM73897.1 hypothetical protein [Enterovirga sp. DB1703]
MKTQAFRKLTTACAAALAAAVLAGPVLADDETAVAGEILVEGITATPARAGQTTRVTFSIENQGLSPVTVMGLRLSTGEPSRVMGFLGTSHSTAMQGVPVEPGETAQLSRRTFWIEVGPLKTDLPAGAVIPGTLLLGRFETPISVHAVRGAAKGDPSSTGSLPEPRE